jgi:hypothetical protein
MPSFIPEGTDVAGMMGMMAASNPTTSAGSGDPFQPIPEGGGQIDWSGLANFWSGFMEPLKEVAKYLPPYLNKELGASPQEQLARQIYQKMYGGDLSYASRNPTDHARLMQVMAMAERAQTDSTFRQTVATFLGWNSSNAHVQYWVNNGGAVPANPTTTDSIPSGGTGTGVSGTGAAQADPSAATVQDPFPSQFFNNPSYQGNNYGDPKPADTYWGGWQWHQGQDYGVPQGTQLSFPFAGKVTQVGYDPNGDGNYVTVTFGDQGLHMTYAHLSYVQVKQGDTVTPGQQVALSGGDGPGAGISTGAHLLVVLQDAHNNPIDPRPLLQQIYGGATLGQLEKLGVGQTGSTQATGSYVTPDGHVIWPGSPDDAYYSMISTVYEHYYGTKPPWSMVMAMRQSGIQNTDQMAAVAANWPSDIPGVNFGTRENIYNTANGIAVKNYGRPIPDALVKQLAQQGRTTNDDIKEWFDTHISADMPAADYQQIYDAVNPMFQSTYNQGPSPEYIGYLWGQTQVPALPAGATPATTPPVTAPKTTP